MTALCPLSIASFYCALVLIGQGGFNSAPQIILDGPLNFNIGSGGIDYRTNGASQYTDIIFSTAGAPSTMSHTMVDTNAESAIYWFNGAFGRSGIILPNRLDAGFGSVNTLAPGALAGFFWLPQISGPPTGLPASLAAFVNMLPCVIEDGAAPKFWARSRNSGTWKGVLLT